MEENDDRDSGITAKRHAEVNDKLDEFETQVSGYREYMGKSVTEQNKQLGTLNGKVREYDF